MKRKDVFVVLTAAGMVFAMSMSSCKKGAEPPTTQPTGNVAATTTAYTPTATAETPASTTQPTGTETTTAPVAPKETPTPTTHSSTDQAAPSKQAKITGAAAGIDALDAALTAFETDCGRFPTTEEGLAALMQQPQDVKNWMGPYLKTLPKDPWGRPYQYAYPGQHNPAGFDVWSNGPDGRSGTSDDIGNWKNK